MKMFSSVGEIVIAAAAVFTVILSAVAVQKDLPGWVLWVAAMAAASILGAAGWSWWLRKSKVNLAVLQKEIEPDPTKPPPPAPTQPLKWPLKLRLVLKNASSKSVLVGRPTWQTTNRGAQLHLDAGLGYSYRHEQALGSWKDKKWGATESPEIEVKPGEVFAFWLGLHPNHSGDLQRMLNEKATGTVIFPVSVRGRSGSVEIDL